MSCAALDRRCLLITGSVAAGLALAVGRARGGQGPLFVSCRRDSEDRYHVSGIDQTGQLRFDLPLPERGHGAAFRPGRDEGVVFARRPGTFAVVFDPIAGVALRRLDSARGRHFYGHGAFSDDGRYLFTSENAYKEGRGVIGIRDVTDGYRQIGEFDSFGIGPHQLVLMPDRATLGVANGGILTHPDRGRAKLNLDSMAPSLAYVDLSDGKLRGDYRLAEQHHRLSIRHVAPMGSHGLAIAMQYEGDKQDLVPLVATHDGGEIRLMQAPERVQRQMRQYGGSVAVDQSGELIAVSAPRGNLITFWEAGGAYLTSTILPDGSGVAATDTPGDFMMSNGLGQVVRFAPRTSQREVLPVSGLEHFGWDNHLHLASAA